MHDAAPGALGQARALEELGAAVSKHWPDATPLTAGELKISFPNRPLVAGWRLPACLKAPRELLLLIPDLFPYALPKVALATAPPPPELPHVERDGVFCLVSGGSLMELPADVRHVEFVVQEALTLLNEGLAGANRDDFLDEISTYWVLGQSASVPFWFASNGAPVSRVVSASALDDAVVVADDEASVKRWVKRAWPGRSFESPAPAAFIVLPSPLYPDQYPRNSGELKALVEGDEAGAQVLARTLRPGKPCRVVLGFSHRGQPALVGLTIVVGTQLNASQHAGQPLWHGYRKGKVPDSVMLDRVAAARFPITRSIVTRVDSRSMLQRTNGSQSDKLANASVALIGCGALGASVARLLAQAGVRRLTLMDGETLLWQNVGRHSLSGNFVGANKAQALGSDISSRFPDYEVTVSPNRWQEEWKSNPGFFEGHDLIVALTGDWVSDCLLNDLSKPGIDVPPVIFGWVEAHALAGHALAVLPKGGCLRCACDRRGEFRYAVAQVPSEHALLRESSCGAFYQPFSAAAAAPSAALITKLALDALLGRTMQSEHRVWAGAAEDFDALDATLSHIWAEKLAAGGYERVFRAPLARDVQCPVCGKSA